MKTKSHNELAELESQVIAKAENWYEAKVADHGAAAELVQAIENLRAARTRDSIEPQP